MASNPNLRTAPVGKNNGKKPTRDNQVSPTPDNHISRINMLIKKVEQALEI